MAGSDFLETRPPETSWLRKWLLIGLLLSLLIHLSLIFLFASTKLERFSTTTERLVPRVFNMSRAVIDPKVLDETLKEEPKAEPPRTELEVPKETAAFAEMMGQAPSTPSAPDLPKPILNEKPKVGTNEIKSLAKFQDETQKAMDKELASLGEEALQDTAKTSSVNLSTLANKAVNKTAGQNGTGNLTANFSSLDSLLAQSGGIKKGTKPILLPTDLLFDFDKTALRSEALSSLEKLGTLIKRNPNITFIIEGHTDSFGTDAHNQSLSLERANMVKAWLIEKMEIDPAHVESKGFGSSRVLIQPNATVTSKTSPQFSAEVERQQLNRRVEIVMRWLE